MAETAEKSTESFSKADQFVLELFKEKLPNSYLYHNYNHTVRVVKTTKEIFDNSQINVDQKEALILAAWLHDTGYTVTRDGHEEASVEIAKEYMAKEDIDAETQELVVQLIASTKMGVEPQNELERILKDADNSHFAKDYYAQTSEFLRQELLLTETKKFSPAEWREENIQMFTHKHKFYTDYAARNWKSQKDENLISLLKKEKKKKKQILLAQ